MRLVLALVALLACAAPARADWSPRPDHPLNSPDTSARGVTAATVAGVPYVGWAESTNSIGNGPVYVARPDGGGDFAPVGGAVTGAGLFPQLADVGGTPHIAVLDSNQFIKVFALQDGAWAEVGPSIAAGSNTQVGGLIDLGGQPAVAYRTDTGTVEIDKLVGTTWTKLGDVITSHAGNNAFQYLQLFSMAPALVANGGAPIVAVGESKPAPDGFGSQLLAYAYEFNGSAWIALNSDQPLAPATDDSYTNGLTMVGSTPYIAFDHLPPDGPLTAGVFSLSGTTPAQLGGLVATDGGATPTGMTIGAYHDAPIAVLQAFLSGDPGLIVKSLAGSEWSQTGSPLGVPPLPTAGNTYPGAAIAVDTAADIPYVIFEQQAPGHNEQFQNAYVEGYIPGAVSPTAPPGSNTNPPTVTVTGGPSAVPTAGPTASPAPAAAASLELVGAPTLQRRRLRSGLRASCPAGATACPGTLSVKGKKVKRTVRFSVPAGAGRTIGATLPKAVAKRVRKRGATVKVTVTGPNGAAATLSQRLRG